jgi:hypothetical protein
MIKATPPNSAVVGLLKMARHFFKQNPEASFDRVSRYLREARSITLTEQEFGWLKRVVTEEYTRLDEIMAIAVDIKKTHGKLGMVRLRRLLMREYDYYLTEPVYKEKLKPFFSSHITEVKQPCGIYAPGVKTAIRRLCYEFLMTRSQAVEFVFCAAYAMVMDGRRTEIMEFAKKGRLVLDPVLALSLNGYDVSKGKTPGKSGTRGRRRPLQAESA